MEQKKTGSCAKSHHISKNFPNLDSSWIPTAEADSQKNNAYLPFHFSKPHFSATIGHSQSSAALYRAVFDAPEKTAHYIQMESLCVGAKNNISKSRVSERARPQGCERQGENPPAPPTVFSINIHKDSAERLLAHAHRFEQNKSVCVLIACVAGSENAIMLTWRRGVRAGQAFYIGVNAAAAT